MKSPTSKQPRDHTRQEQPPDRGFRGDAVDDHGDRGRDQDAQRAARRDGACGHPVRIAALAHLGDAHLADGGTGGGLDPDIAENSAQAPEVGHHQPAGHAGQPAFQRLIKVRTRPGRGDGRAHDDEHRDRQQREIVELAEEDLRHQFERAHPVER
jgi:hypothetical protein